MNTISIVGRAVADPEVKYTAQGHAVVNFRVAVDRSFKNADGNREADFFTVVAWRKPAETIGNYLKKGRLVSVKGRMQMRQYEAQDGAKRTVWEVQSEEVNFLDGKKESPQDGVSDAASEALPEDLPF